MFRICHKWQGQRGKLNNERDKNAKMTGGIFAHEFLKLTNKFVFSFIIIGVDWASILYVKTKNDSSTNNQFLTSNYNFSRVGPIKTLKKYIYKTYIKLLKSCIL